MPKRFAAWEHPLKLDRARPELGGISLNDLRAAKFEELGRFKAASAFPAGYNRDYLSFYAPRDPGVHQVLLWTVLQATHSVAINMYGFDDPQILAVLRHHATTPHLALTVSLDSSQAAGIAEKPLLEELRHDLPGNSIAVGRSAKGAISHDKLMVIDGTYLISGSTNWSFGGELEQDNQLTLARDAVAAAEARTVIDLDHDAMLKQMAAHATAAKTPAKRSTRSPRRTPRAKK
jgi:phosphatidylserine/phosphatidylglycerophosphate/cardiolipin synthase-like enzyme